MQLPPGASLGKKLAKGDLDLFGENQLAAGYSLVDGWPDQLRCLLKDITDAKRESARGSREYVGEFARFFNANARSNRLSVLLRATIPPLLGEMELPLKAVGGARAIGPDRVRTICAAEVVTCFGLKYQTVQRLDGVGDCFITKGVGAEGVRLFDREKLSASVKIYKAAKRDHEVSQDLGLPAYVLINLEARGLLVRVADPDATRLAGDTILYTASSVTELHASLTGWHQGVAGSGVSVQSALSGRLHPEEWGAVIAALLDGSLPVKGRKTAKGIIAELLVWQRDVEAVLAGVPRSLLPTGVVLSARAAATVLGVHNVVVSAAVTAGLLPASQTANRSVIRLEDLARFCMEYLFTGQIAAVVPDVGYHPKIALERAGVAPAAKLGNRYIWRRADIDRLKL